MEDARDNWVACNECTAWSLQGVLQSWCQCAGNSRPAMEIRKPLRDERSDEQDGGQCSTTGWWWRRPHTWELRADNETNARHETRGEDCNACGPSGLRGERLESALRGSKKDVCVCESHGTNFSRLVRLLTNLNAGMAIHPRRHAATLLAGGVWVWRRQCASSASWVALSVTASGSLEVMSPTPVGVAVATITDPSFT